MDTYDVAVVGAGPVGLYLALRVAQRGHSVIVLEKQPAPYPLPRAVHFDDEVARLLAQAGIAAELRGIIEEGDIYDWRNADGRTLLRFEWAGDGDLGWPRMNMFCQPELEKILSARAGAEPLITVRRGEEVAALQVDTGTGAGPHAVTVTSHGPTLKHRQVQAKYVVGCDGAGSKVREYLGTSMTDLGFFYDWLVVDLLPLRPEERTWSPVNIQVCDPKRPTSAVSGGPGRRRFEFMRRPEETIADLENEATVWELLRPWDYTPGNATIERSAIYTFQARWADVWYRDRIAIAGDAAHLMPPFAGQGMCSGIRDAANLAWKLDLALRGLAGDALLGTYTTERSAHVKNAIEQSVALGNVICTADPKAAAERDEYMLAVGPDPEKVLPPVAPARLGPGVIDPAGGELAGTAVPVPASADGSWAIVSPLKAHEALDAQRLAQLDRYGVRWEQAPQDGAAAVVRPDGYLYGTAATTDRIPAFTDGLLRRLAGEETA